MLLLARVLKREYFFSTPQVAINAREITIKGTTENTELIGACKFSNGICPAATPPGLICLRTMPPLIPPMTIPTISIDQTTATNLERFDSSETSTSSAVKGVELQLTAIP